MDAPDDAIESLLDLAIAQLNEIINYLPTIAAVVLILVLGWIGARLSRLVVKKAVNAANQMLTRAFPSGFFSSARVSPLGGTLLGELAFWAVVLMTLTVAARFAELTTVSQWLTRLIAHLPNLLAGIIIIATGYVVSVLVRDELTARETGGGAAFRPTPGHIVQATVLAIAIIVGLDQVGIDVTLVIGLTVMISAGLIIALAVAFALGARTHIRNLIGARTARTYLGPGMTIKIGDIEGQVVEITSTLVTLETVDGRLLVPGRLVDENAILIVVPQDHHGEAVD